MKKQGFTLIELMVVIVIMGILAAVAVPKLFGMIAKSKASEVGPAAGTYVKLQQAYISESVAVGNWSVIGYKGPGTNTNASGNGAAVSATNNFSYTDASGWTENTKALGSTAVVGFSASNKAKLNDCAPAANWTISVTAGSAAGEATFTPSTLGAECTQLTPNWKQIGM